MGCSQSSVADKVSSPDVLIPKSNQSPSINVVPPPPATLSSSSPKNKLPEILEPKVGFVLKAKTTDQKKVFVNVFHHETVTTFVSYKSETSSDKDIYNMIISTSLFLECVDSKIRNEVLDVKIFWSFFLTSRFLEQSGVCPIIESHQTTIWVKS
jgi:hypothetical protein